MLITNLLIQPAQRNTFQPSQKTNLNAPKLNVLQHDTVSFGKLKKSQIDGYSLAVTTLYGAPLETFKTKNDMAKWAKAEYKTHMDSSNYKILPYDKYDEKKLRIPNEERKERLEKWKKHLDNLEEGPFAALIVAEAITRILEENNQYQPPVIRPKILSETLEEVRKNPKQQINFLNRYEFNMRKDVLGLTDDELNNYTGWEIIPGLDEDTESFGENVDNLNILSHRNWCTKSNTAATSLNLGNFHVYLKNGKTKIGLGFDEDMLYEIQGPKNNNKIPEGYKNLVRNYLVENEFSRIDPEIREYNFLMQPFLTEEEKIMAAKTGHYPAPQYYFPA